MASPAFRTGRSSGQWGDAVAGTSRRPSPGRHAPLRDPPRDRLVPGRLSRGVSLHFQALLHLSGAAVPAERRAILEAAAKVLPLQADVYRQALDIRENKDRLSGADVRAFLEPYLREVHRLASLMDGMGSKEDQRPNTGGDP